MVNGGNGNRSCVELEVSGEELVDGSEDGDLVSCFGVSCPGRIGLDGSGEDHTEASRFQFAIDAQMITSERAGPGDCNP